MGSGSMKARLLALAFLGVSCFFTSSAFADPIPSLTLQVESPQLVSEPVDLKLAFSNTSATATDTGYYPLIEIVLPDGVTCDAACRSAITIGTPAGAPVTVQAFGGFGIAGASYINPVTGESIALAANETLLIITPPTGTIAVGQAAITYTIPATFTTASVIGSAENIRGRGIFALGASPSGTRVACGSGVGPNQTICQAPQATTSVTPVVLKLDMETEGEACTGPNHPRTITSRADVATGRNLSAVQVQNAVPEDFVFTSLPGADCLATPGSLNFNANPPLACSFSDDGNPGGGTLLLDYGAFLGVAGADRVLSYSGYVQEFLNGGASPVLDPVSGNPDSVALTGSASASGNPAVNDSVEIPESSVSLDKSAQILIDAAPSSGDPGQPLVSPGDTVEWTLHACVSDYFSFVDTQITDVIRDGQTYVDGTMSLRVQEGGLSQTELEAALEAPTAYLNGLNPPVVNGNGETNWSLDLSQAMADSSLFGGSLDAALSGSEAAIAAATLTYQTLIQENYVSPDFGSAVVDANDVIRNDGSLNFEVDGGGGVGNGSIQNSNAGAQVTISPLGAFAKVIAFNNSGGPLDQVAPGDEVTFQVSFTVPSGDLEDFKITDYLPTPLFNAVDPLADGSNAAFNQISDGDTAPAPGEWRFTSTSSLSPPATVSSSANDNSVVFDFADLIENGGASASETIQILFTLTATNEPMDDALRLANVLIADYGNSNDANFAATSSTSALIVSQEPSLEINKVAESVISGVATDSGDNFTNAQSGSVLEFTVTAENNGSQDAYDVEITDVLNAAFAAPGGTIAGYNLIVADGGGIGTCDFSGVADTSDLSQLHVEGLVISPGGICEISYRLELLDSARYGETIPNTAKALFASEPGGTVFSPEQDTATTAVDVPAIVKSYVVGSSSLAYSADTPTPPDLAVGETAQFRLAVTVPSGSGTSFILRETDISDFAENFSSTSFVFPTIVACPSDPAKFSFSGLGDVCFANDPSLPANQASSGGNYNINFGNFTNATGANAAFDVFVTVQINQGRAAGNYQNQGRVLWNNANGQQNRSENETITLVRPNVSLAKTTSTAAPVKIGQTIQYQIVVTNSGASPAFDVANIVDTLPTGLAGATLVSASSGANDVTSLVAPGFNLTGNLLSIPVRDDLNNPDIGPGATFTVVYQVTVQGTVPADSIAGPGHPGGVVDGPGFVPSLDNNADIPSYYTNDGGTGEQVTNIPNSSISLQLDSDGDGIPNVDEGNGDHDGDGVPDYLDTDSDDNGIGDPSDGKGDSDGDGTPDYQDTDDDNDGEDDWTEIENGGGDPLQDTDGDGVPDFNDPDSDNDGVGDGVEQGGWEPPGYPPAQIPNVDGDGGLNKYDLDSDNDGIPDLVEDGLGACDLDGSGQLNATEIASCGDDFPVPACANPTNCDANGNGVIDPGEFAGGGLRDSDGDGIPDRFDLDSDNDGLRDLYEAGFGPYDSNNDGYIESTERAAADDGSDSDITGGTNDNNSVVDFDEIPDSDGDGIPDYLDIDSDSDGVPDIVENGRYICDSDSDGQIDYPTEIAACSAADSDPDGAGPLQPNGFLDPNELATPDRDGDGKLDYLDLDSDGDGIADWIEAYPNDVDTNDDGKIDAAEYETAVGGATDTLNFNELTDTDSDGTPDIYDSDSDNDGILDLHESDNRETYPNYDPATVVDNYPDLFDTDGDGIPDFRETDSDNDGYPDSEEAGDVVPGTPPVDTDGDGTPDFQDQDSDGDGLNDVDEKTQCRPGDPSICSDRVDPDTDNDGLSDGCEVYGNTPDCPIQNQPWYPGPGTPAAPITDPTNSDSDCGGTGNVCGCTPDGEEITQGTDPRVGHQDDDSNNSEDSDGDGIPNDQEVLPGELNDPSQSLCNDPDTDNDGLSDFEENNNSHTPPNNPDADGDQCTDGQEFIGNVSDPNDPDSDDDGLQDCLETGIGTDPRNPDTDGDGSGDADEYQTCHSPTNADSDGDGLSDGDEIDLYHTDPCDADTDNGGVPDGVEVKNGGNPLDPGDDDADGDGVSNGNEERYGTDPNNPNSDNDECDLSDGKEWGDDLSGPPRDSDGDGLIDALDPDSDNDGRSDCDEAAIGSDPLKADLCIEGSGALGSVDGEPDCLGWSCSLDRRASESTKTTTVLVMGVAASALALGLRRRLAKSRIKGRRGKI